MDECVPNSGLGIDSVRGFVTVVVVPETEFCTNAPLAGVALRSGILATEDRFEAQRDHCREKLNCVETGI